MKKTLYLLTVLVTIFILTILLWPNKSISHHILLKESGFIPQSLTISKGDTIIFTSERSEQFWPASDLHPTHGIYPEFDPKQPIEASSSWKFKFDHIGDWRFHDHLTPIYRGKIHVKD